MAATNYTPIQLYYSATAAAVPINTNLASGELAINTADGLLFYKDSGGTVQKIGYKLTPTTAGGTGLTSFTANGVVYASSTSALATGSALTFNGTNTVTLNASAANLTLGISTNYGLVTATGTNPASIYFNGGSRTSFESHLQYFGANHTFFNETGGSEIMRLLNTGNVGIGTSSPAAKLHVLAASQSAIFASTSATLNYTEYRYNTTTVNGYIGNGGILTGSGSATDFVVRSEAALAFATGGATEKMRLDSSGNLGIGTTSPAALKRLHVANVAAGSGMRVSGPTSDNNWAGGIEFYSDNATTTTSNILVSSGGMQFGYGGSERMRIDSSGNLGLGVTPSAWPASRPAIEIGGTTTGNLAFNGNNTNGYQIWMNSYYNGSVSVYKYNGFANNCGGGGDGSFFWNLAASGTAGNTITFTQAMTLTAAGNLGIGTSSPTKRLEVHSSTSGGQQARFIDNSGVGGGGRGGGISMGGVSNDTGPVYADYARILALKTNATQGNTQGFLLFQVNDGSAQASAMSISSARIVTMDAYGAGTATFSAAGVISSVSDETWKIKDGVPVDPDAMLNKLSPGYWYYNEEKAPAFGAERQLGFYAQNVNSAIGPEAAPTPEEGKPWGYYDRSVLAVTVMSLQKALATIETLTARITALEGA